MKIDYYAIQTAYHSYVMLPTGSRILGVALDDEGAYWQKGTPYLIVERPIQTVEDVEPRMLLTLLRGHDVPEDAVAYIGTYVVGGVPRHVYDHGEAVFVGGALERKESLTGEDEAEAAHQRR